MKRLLPVVIVFGVFLFSAGESFALPECKRSPVHLYNLSDIRTWNYCEGTIIFNNGDKYVGEYKDGKKNGQGAFTWAGGRVKGVREGIWEQGQLKYAQKVTSTVCEGSPTSKWKIYKSWTHCIGVMVFGGLLNGVLNILGNGKMDVSAKVSCTHVYSAR